MNGKTAASQALIRASQQVSKPDKKVVIGPGGSTPKHEIKVHKSNDLIQSIEIKCKCGETIIVDCQYE
jgi:hypothetical protein